MATETAVIERTPLTNPVPGVWMLPPGGTVPVYVPDELNGKTGHYQRSPHFKRLLSEDGHIVAGPGDVQSVAPQSGPSAKEAAMQAEIDELKAALRELMGERNQAAREAMSGAKQASKGK